MSRRNALICVWSGPVGFGIFGIGIWPLAHFLPPLLPSADAAAIAQIYNDHLIGIRLGSILVMFGSALLAPFFSMLIVQTKRIEGESAPLATTQLMSAAVAVAALVLGGLFWTVAAFRPDRSIEATQTLNDIGWILLVTPAAPFFVQAAALGLAILSDKTAGPILPRWSGYLCLWLAVLALPGALAIMFKTGPFAWNGILAFWLPFGLVGGWAFLMAFLMTSAVNKRAAA